MHFLTNKRNSTDKGIIFGIRRAMHSMKLKLSNNDKHWLRITAQRLFEHVTLANYYSGDDDTSFYGTVYKITNDVIRRLHSPIAIGAIVAMSLDCREKLQNPHVPENFRLNNNDLQIYRAFATCMLENADHETTYDPCQIYAFVEHPLTNSPHTDNYMINTYIHAKHVLVASMFPQYGTPLYNDAMHIIKDDFKLMLGDSEKL